MEFDQKIPSHGHLWEWQAKDGFLWYHKQLV